jgi:hypothetical protein
MSDNNFSRQEPSLFIFLETPQKFTAQFEEQLYACQERNTLSVHMLDDHKTIILQGKLSALHNAHLEFQGLLYDAKISTFDKLFTPDEPQYADKGIVDTVQYNYRADRILAIYPFSNAQLKAVQSSHRPVSLVDDFLQSAAPRDAFEADLDKILLDISKHHNISQILEEDDEYCTYIVGNKQAIDFAQQHLMGTYGSVIMTIKQYDAGLDPWAIKQTDQPSSLTGGPRNPTKH